MGMTVETRGRPVVPVETGTHPLHPWIPAFAGMTVVQGSSCAGMTEMRSTGLMQE